MMLIIQRLSFSSYQLFTNPRNNLLPPYLHKAHLKAIAKNIFSHKNWNSRLTNTQVSYSCTCKIIIEKNNRTAKNSICDVTSAYKSCKSTQLARYPLVWNALFNSCK